MMADPVGWRRSSVFQTRKSRLGETIMGDRPITMTASGERALSSAANQQVRISSFGANCRVPTTRATMPPARSADQVDLVLPPRETKRWSSRRKAAVLVAVRTGVVSREGACQLYSLSEEELAGWEAAFDRVGIPGLLVTRLQSYRRRLCNSKN
jgi:hypothetical protein